MDWMKQSEEMFKTWTDTQKAMWDEWIKAMQSFGRPHATDSWKRTVDAWQESIKESLHLQMECSKLWAESLNSVKGAPKEVHEWARQGQEMMIRWAETQMQLWTAWFDMVKKLDPTALGRTSEKESDNIVHIWQESFKNVLDAQAEWARIWTATQTGKKPREQAKTEA
ncbi:MAG TPA: hypothetical protein VJ746_10450 [Nitrospira sp.]|nr:hypothetical protein [Nitrospira sp.]